MASAPDDWPRTTDPLRPAVGAIQRGDWPAALAACESALTEAAVPSQRGDALMLRSVTRQALTDPAGARDDAAAALLAWAQAGPATIGAHLVSLARTLAGAGERAAALRFLAAAVEVVTGGTGTEAVAIDLGVIAAGLGEDALARRAWQSATRGEPGAAAVAHVNLAQLELDGGLVEAALDHVEAALRRDEGAHIERGVELALDVCAVLAETGSHDGIAEVLARLDAAAPPPVNRRRWYGVEAALEYDRGILALSNDESEAAAEHLGRAERLEENVEQRIAILLGLAGIDARWGRTTSALARADEASRQAGDDVQRLDVAAVLVEIGEAAAERGEWSVVTEAYSAAATLYQSAGRLELARAFHAAASAGRVR